MTRRIVLVLALAAAVALAAAPAERAPDRLYSQLIASQLQRDFSDPNLSYIVIDARSGDLLASRWPSLSDPVPVGSLIKPFTALAYAGQHEVFPTLVCRGGRFCWSPRAHGRLDLAQAIADSCNDYFRQLAELTSDEQVSVVLRRFGLPPVAPDAPADVLIGAGDQWRVAPLSLLRAYVQLAGDRSSRGAARVIAGMLGSARAGTGRGVDDALSLDAALAKTGTAPCIHGGAPGDGYAIALYPADAPRLAVLVRVHDRPGSHAAQVAGRMLHLIAEGQ